MLYLIAIGLLQLFCIIHIIRSDTHKLWILAIIFLPLLGGLAYLALEVVPSIMGNRRMRHVKKTAVSKIDPDRDVRLARERLAVTDSLANQIDLADALVARGSYGEAIGLYEKAMGHSAIRDDGLAIKYSEALLYNDAPEKALHMLDRTEEPGNSRDLQKYLYLKAQSLEELKRTDEAAAIYDRILDKSTDNEIRCRYSALLLAQGDMTKAKALLEEVEYSAKMMDRSLIAEHADMYRWAKDQLLKLRTS